MKYTLICRERANQLAERVTELLLEGWQLHGSPTVGVNAANETVYLQALIYKAARPLPKVTVDGSVKPSVTKGG